MKDDLNFVIDTDPKKEKKEFISSTVNNTLLWGVIIGFGVCLCLFGIGQQFLPMLDSNQTLIKLVHRFWFDIQWWYWLIPLAGLLLLFVITRAKALRSMLGDSWI